MNQGRIKLVVATTLVATTLGLQPPSAHASSAATVTGPVTGGVNGAPFSQPTVDLDAYGYVAEEFFLDGSASAYRLVEGSELSPDGRWQTQREEETVPYRTRFLVVRPRDQSRFNGTVVVHWQNVTAGFELGSVTAGEYLRGYAWVGVSAQSVGVNGFPGPDAAGLKQWDPERYGSLNHPGDAYSYAIFSDAARAVGPDRAKSTLDPMGGLEVERLVAAGASQSASRLRTYINGVHPIEKVFDGYMPYIDFASPVPFAGDGSGNRRGSRVSSRIREDLGVPVFVVNSETETLAYFPARQPDSETFRFWEVSGTSHVSVARQAVSTTPGMENPNWLSYTPVYNVALRHMHVWLTEGTSPPQIPPIETIAGDSNRPTLQRDERGNALGGVRLPAFAVASSEHRGNGTRVPGGSRFAFLYGYSRAFTATELAELYPSRQAFLEKYDRALEGAVVSGTVLAEDAPGLQEAAQEWAKKELP